MILAARLILALVFIVAGFAKLADRAGSREAARAFGVPERLSGVVGGLLPLVELAAAGLLLVPGSARVGSLVALGLLGVFTAGIARAMVRGEAPDCHCFGTLHSEPAGPRTLARNGLLAAIAVVPLVAHRPGPSPWGWIGGLDTTQTWLLGALALLAAALAAQSAFLLGLLRQNGRILSRLDALELTGGAPSEADLGWDDGRYGLPVGDPAPPFVLPAIDGPPVTLEELRAPGRPVLLLFTDPGCGPCEALLPEIGRWQREHSDLLTVAVVSRGGAEDNRAKVEEHGVTRVLLQTDREVAEAFNCPATPTALVVGADATIAHPAAPGADAIRALVHAATTGAPSPFQVIPPAAPALPVGALAPTVSLTDLDGDTIDLADPSAQRRLLLFWDPGCGFCQGMVGELRAWEERADEDAPELVLISTGTEVDNRALGLDARIVLDPSFTVGAAFGIAGTPSARPARRHRPRLRSVERRSPRRDGRDERVTQTRRGRTVELLDECQPLLRGRGLGARLAREPERCGNPARAAQLALGLCRQLDGDGLPAGSGQ